jgi:hypothetical protein
VEAVDGSRYRVIITLKRFWFGVMYLKKSVVCLASGSDIDAEGIVY